MLLWLTLGCADPPPPPPVSEVKVDPCEPAWEEMQRLAPTMEAAVGGSFRKPTKETFLSTCHKLPSAARPCVSLRYQIDHADECTQAMSGLSNKEKKKLIRALSTPLDGSPAPQ